MRKMWRGLVVAVATVMVVAIAVDRMGAALTDKQKAGANLPQLTPSRAQEISRRFPASRYVIVLGRGSCGSPFRSALNYLHQREQLEGVAVITGSREFRLFRELRERRGLTAEADDELLAASRPYGNVLIVERARGRKQEPLVYQFDVVSTSEMILALDEILLGSSAGSSRRVPGTGIEPARPKGHRPLKTARLPIPPPGQGVVIPPGLEPGTL